jgi:hypothetical protein
MTHAGCWISHGREALFEPEPSLENGNTKRRLHTETRTPATKLN